MTPNYESNNIAGIPWSNILDSQTKHKEILEHLLQLHNFSINSLSIHLGVSWIGLDKKLYEEGIIVVKRKNFVDKIKELGNVTSLNSAEIGKIVGCSQNCAARICRENGIVYKKRINGTT